MIRNKSKVGIFSLLVVVGLIQACSSQPAVLPPLETGKWELVTTDSDVVAVTVSELNSLEYYFDAGKHPVSGVYVLNGPSVVMAKPNNPRMGDIVWRLETRRSLVLTTEPSVELSGMHLLASKMTKLTR